MKTLVTVAAFGLAVLVSTAVTAGHEHIQVSAAWSREVPPVSDVGVVYFTVSNHGHVIDRLVGISTPKARKAEMHTSSMEDGVMKMRRLEAIEVSPGEPAVFQPGGNHGMLMQLTSPLVKGERFPLTLQFERAGAVQVMVEVKHIGAMSAGSHSEHGGAQPAVSHDHGQQSGHTNTTQ